MSYFIYINFFSLIIIIKLFLGIVYSEEIVLNAIIYSYYDTEDSYYRLLSNEFNEYSRKKGLGIYVNLEVLTPKISTTEFENYGTTINSLLLRKSPKYDIYFYYSAYSEKYGSHFLNLKDYLPEEYIKRFDENILKETCYSNDNELIGVVIYNL